MSLFLKHHQDLKSLTAHGRGRRLIARRGRDFSSNDYLGLAASPQLTTIAADALGRGAPVGSGGSRLLRGNHAEHEALEAEAARFFKCEASLFFSSGYAANAALFAALPQRGDLVVYDEFIHASAHEGMRLGRAECRPAVHNDADSFDDTIDRWRRKGGRGRVWIAAETLYSMDGDIAPLASLAQIAEQHEAVLLLDEAHATGVFGTRGEGLASELHGRENVIVLHTCGKAMGCEGALLSGPKVARDFLVNRGRHVIFSTAPSPLMAAVVRGALDLIAGADERRAELSSLMRVAQASLGPLGATFNHTQILPLVIRDDVRTMKMADALQAAGFDVRGIRPPTVPHGTSRLRISLTLNIGRYDIEALADALKRARAKAT